MDKSYIGRIKALQISQLYVIYTENKLWFQHFQERHHYLYAD